MCKFHLNTISKISSASSLHVLFKIPLKYKDHAVFQVDAMVELDLDTRISCFANASSVESEHTINMKSIAAQAGVSVTTISGLLIVRKWSPSHQGKNLGYYED